MKKKINVLDILIILFLAVVVVAGAMLVKGFMSSESTETKIIVVESTKLKQSFCDNLTTGETAFDGVQNVELGKVVDCEVKPCEVDSISADDGTVKRVKYPERFDALISIEVPKQTDVQVGKQLWIETQTYKCSGYVIEIK